MTIDNHNNEDAINPTELGEGDVDMSGPESPHFKVDSAELTESVGSVGSAELEATPDVAAWEEVAEGRFMPRRVRGSCQGRALGWTFTVPSSGSDEKQ